MDSFSIWHLGGPSYLFSAQSVLHSSGQKGRLLRLVGSALACPRRWACVALAVRLLKVAVFP